MPKRRPPDIKGPATEIRKRIEHHLKRLGLTGLDVAAHLAWVRDKGPSDLEAVERLFAMAVALKRERSIEWRVKGCGLKDRKTMASFDWDFQPKLDRRTVEGFFTFAFVESREDLLITGKSSTGKSHILKALTLKACEQEWMVRYSRCVDLIDGPSYRQHRARQRAKQYGVALPSDATP